MWYFRLQNNIAITKRAWYTIPHHYYGQQKQLVWSLQIIVTLFQRPNTSSIYTKYTTCKLLSLNYNLFIHFLQSFKVGNIGWCFLGSSLIDVQDLMRTQCRLYIQNGWSQAFQNFYTCWHRKWICVGMPFLPEWSRLSGEKRQTPMKRIIHSDIITHADDNPAHLDCVKDADRGGLWTNVTGLRGRGRWEDETTVIKLDMYIFVPYTGL